MSRPKRVSNQEWRRNMQKRGITFYANFFKLVADALITGDPELNVLFAEMTPENQKNCIKRFLQDEYGVDSRRDLPIILNLIDLIS